MDDIIIIINCGGKRFQTTKRTLDCSEYFNGIITNTTIDKEIFVDRDPTVFKKILNYMRDPKYPVSIKYLYELDFYGIKYPKYNKYTPDIVTINLRGKEFKLPANMMMNGSILLDKKLSELYIGEVLYLDRSPKAFKHVIERIYDETYVIPFDCYKERKYYGIQNLKITTDTIMGVCTLNHSYKIKADILLKIPKFKEYIDKYENIPVLKYFNDKAFCNFAEYLIGGNPLYKYKYLFDYFGITPTRYYEVEYSKCYMCDVFNKQYKSNDGWLAGNSSDYCHNHRCLLCHKGREETWLGTNSYCIEHNNNNNNNNKK
jgi:hypothetical protein